MPVPGIWDLMEASWWIEQNCCNSDLNIDLRIERDRNISEPLISDNLLISWNIANITQGYPCPRVPVTSPLHTVHTSDDDIGDGNDDHLDELIEVTSSSQTRSCDCKQSIPSAPVPDSRGCCTDTREPWISDERVSCFYSDEVKLKGIGSQHNFAPDKENIMEPGCCDLSKVCDCVNVRKCVSVTRAHGHTSLSMSLLWW